MACNGAGSCLTLVCSTSPPLFFIFFQRGLLVLAPENPSFQNEFLNRRGTQSCDSTTPPYWRKTRKDQRMVKVQQTGRSSLEMWRDTRREGGKQRGGSNKYSDNAHFRGQTGQKVALLCTQACSCTQALKHKRICLEHHILKLINAACTSCPDCKLHCLLY